MGVVWFGIWIFQCSGSSALPVQGIDFIIGNVLAGGKVIPVVHVTNIPLVDQQPDALAQNFPNVFAANAVTTRAQAKRLIKENEMSLGESVFDGIFEKDVFPECLDTSKSIATSVVCPNPDVFLPVLYYALIEAQKSDPTLAKCRLSVDIKMLPLRNHQFYWNSTVLLECSFIK